MKEPAFKDNIVDYKLCKLIQQAEDNDAGWNKASINNLQHNEVALPLSHICADLMCVKSSQKVASLVSIAFAIGHYVASHPDVLEE